MTTSLEPTILINYKRFSKMKSLEDRCHELEKKVAELETKLHDIKPSNGNNYDLLNQDLQTIEDTHNIKDLQKPDEVTSQIAPTDHTTPQSDITLVDTPSSSESLANDIVPLNPKPFKAYKSYKALLHIPFKYRHAGEKLLETLEKEKYFLMSNGHLISPNKEDYGSLISNIVLLFNKRTSKKSKNNIFVSKFKYLITNSNKQDLNSKKRKANFAEEVNPANLWYKI